MNYNMVCNGKVCGRKFSNQKCSILDVARKGGDIPVEFEFYIAGHGCSGFSGADRGRSGYCFWVRPDMLTPIIETAVNVGIKLAAQALAYDARKKWSDLVGTPQKEKIMKEPYIMKYKLIKELTGSVIAESASRDQFELFVRDYSYHTPVVYTEEVEKDFMTRAGADGTSSEWVEYLESRGFLKEVPKEEEKVPEGMIYFLTTNHAGLYKLHRQAGIESKEYQWCEVEGTACVACGTHKSFKEAIEYAKKQGNLVSFKSGEAKEAYEWLASQL